MRETQMQDGSEIQGQKPSAGKDVDYEGVCLVSLRFGFMLDGDYREVMK